jgi:uncharacterized membrane protein YfcA
MDQFLTSEFLTFFVIGFLAQVIDGSLGMAYGVSANSFLLGLGVPPAAASASVHTAEVFTTGVSGLSHWKFGNINRGLIKRLVIPGVIGGVIGAYILSNIPGDEIKPFVAIYLLVMGVRILYKAIRQGVVSSYLSKIQLSILGLFGGLMDAVGGGGWGPVVTSTLIANGGKPRESIGSVNLTEFFVTFAEAVTFFAVLKTIDLPVVVGLLLGGVLAAPFGAFLTKKIPARVMLVVVGLLVIGLSIRTIYLAWF